MGVGTISAQRFFVERPTLTPLTSDPAVSTEGELWLRGDVAPETDQIGTVRLDTGGSVVDIPVWAAGLSTGDDIAEHFRVVVGGQQGFVATKASGAAYPKLSVWDSGTRYGAHDSLNAIPDSVVEQVDARKLTGFNDGDTVSTYSAAVGTDLSNGSGTFRSDAAYNQDSVEYNGSNGHQADISTLSQPYTLYAVVDADDVDDGNNHVVVGSQGDGNKNTPDANLAFTGLEWGWFAGNIMVSGSTNKDRQIVTVFADGENTYIREDGAQTGSGNAGSNDIYLLSVGYYGRVDGRGWIGDAPFVEIHDGTPPDGVETREQNIINDWGLSI